MDDKRPFVPSSSLPLAVALAVGGDRRIDVGLLGAKPGLFGGGV